MLRRFALPIIFTACLIPTVILAADLLAPARSMDQQAEAGSMSTPVWMFTLHLTVPNITAGLVGWLLRRGIREEMSALRKELHDRLTDLDGDIKAVTTTANTATQDIARLDERTSHLRIIPHGCAHS